MIPDPLALLGAAVLLSLAGVGLLHLLDRVLPPGPADGGEEGGE